MDSVQKLYRLLLLLVIGGLAWNILPFLASVIVMLIFAFLFTTIFLQSVDTLERRIHSRGGSVLLILRSVITLGLWLFDSFIAKLC